MPGLHLFWKPRSSFPVHSLFIPYSLIILIPYMLVPNLFEEEEKRKLEYELKERSGETFITEDPRT